MKEFLTQLIEWGPFGVLILSALDSAGIPIPNGVDLMIAAVVVNNPQKALLTMMAAILGSLLGNVVLYSIARKGGQAYLDKLTSKGRGRRFRCWFDKYGLVTVFVPAVSLIPMPLKFFVVSAAVFGVPLLRFLSVILVARVIRYGFVAWIALTFGEELTALVKANLGWFALGILALSAAFYFISRTVLKPTPRDSGAEPAGEAGR